MAAEKLRDLSNPMDVALLDATVKAFYATGSKEERAAADNILRDLKDNPDTWLQVSHILQNTRSMHTKYFALQVLEGVIKYRWNALPVEQHDGMKNFISEVIVQLSSNEASFRSERLYVNKLNLILVQILKHEWPANWRNFIPDLVSAAKTSETVCENCMAILKLETLLKFFPVPEYRNLTLQCLAKIAALNYDRFYRNQYVQMYMIFMEHLQGMLPFNVTIPGAYSSGSDEEQASFYPELGTLHIKILESTPESIPFLLSGLEYLISISYVDDTEVFKMVYFPPTVDRIEPEVTTTKILYSDQISKLRGLMIARMAKPEEVLIVEDENGNIVRETMKDSDVLFQYRIMRETLICLTRFDRDDTERQMFRKLSQQINREEWTWNNLNTLCWAIGSISGSMDVKHEEEFVMRVIRALLSFCEIMTGNDNKAVIASNVMYVFGQYSRFLKGNWEYLVVVVNKLFDFMHSTHPGVKDMACDTLLKIVRKCKHIFLVVQVRDHDEEPFISDILASLKTIIRDLEPNQMHTFYESLACIIQAESDPHKMGEYIQRMYSELVSIYIGDSVMYASKISVVRLLRSVTREILKLIKTLIDKDETESQIGKKFVPLMMDVVLGGYARNVPDARESEVLSLFETIIKQYKVAMQNDVPHIFESVFHCTLEMITKNFEDYPEHRFKFFSLLRAIAAYCFHTLLQLSSEVGDSGTEAIDGFSYLGV
ncbi:Protein EXPORTIN 1A [Raphanus sativus]|nr:Protein EXPORTIN 1A [Raphanus sativus]